jgi:D-amino-acid dehydrogenase
VIALPEQGIVVVGAGIVGASVALALQRDAHQVTLVDREAPCAGASFGNAGAIVNASCPPTAMPGAVVNALRMLSRPLSPLAIRPAYLHKLLPWLLRLVLESRRSRVIENAANLHALTRRSIAGWQLLTNGTDFSNLINEGGWLKVYDSARSFAATCDSRDLMDANGVPYDILSSNDIQDLEPNLAPIFERGIFQRDSLWLSDPHRVVQGMVDLFVARGGTFKQFDVQSVDIHDERIMFGNSTNTMRADKAVICAGAWSNSLARQLGDKLPMDTERGYHLMLPAENNRLLKRPIMSGEHSFVLVPMDNGLRLTGLVELADIDAPPDYRLIRRLIPAALKMLPGINGAEESVWMGCRPSLPDSLPVIGVSKRSKNVLYAFGHQHLGITLGPASGLIISDMIAGRDPGLDLEPYRPDRF